MIRGWGSARWPGAAIDGHHVQPAGRSLLASARGGAGQLLRSRARSRPSQGVAAVATVALPHLPAPPDRGRADPGDQLPGAARALPRLWHPHRPRRPDPGGAERVRAGPPLGAWRLWPSRGRADRRIGGARRDLDHPGCPPGAPPAGRRRPQLTPRCARYPCCGGGMNLTRPLLRNGIGVRRILALAMLLAAVAAVAYLERWIGG